MPDELNDQEKKYLVNPEHAEAAARADKELAIEDELAGLIEDNSDAIADGDITIPDLRDEVESYFDLDPGFGPYGEPDPGWDALDAWETPEPEPDAPEPGDLDWWPSDTGVKYPDPERKEGNIGGPERLG